MKLILIRHGETDWVREGRYQGTTDVPLNRRGILQAKAVGKALKTQKPKVIYSSGMKRAYQTAQEIAQICRKQITIDARLNELSFGDWEGKHHKRIGREFPQASQAWYMANWTSCPPRGESLRSLSRRIGSFLSGLLKRHSRNETIAIVAHGGPIRMFLVQILKVAPTVFWTFRIDPASISMIELTIKREELTLLNSQYHLKPGLRRRK